MTHQKRPTKKEIQQACASIYQTCGMLFWSDSHIPKKERKSLEIQVMDILSAISSDEKIPHKKEWYLK